MTTTITRRPLTVVETPERMAQFLDVANRTGRFVVLTPPRAMPGTDRRVWVRVLPTPAATGPVLYTRRPWLLKALTLTAAVTAAIGLLIAAGIWLLHQLTHLLPTVLGVLVVAALLAALLTGGVSTIRHHCPGCRH